MLIRLQDKTGIVHLECVDSVLIYENEKFYIEAFNGEVKTGLGEYSTEERAIKVLDEICEYYASCDIKMLVYNMPEDTP